jgi:hypothetical protein
VQALAEKEHLHRVADRLQTLTPGRAKLELRAFQQLPDSPKFLISLIAEPGLGLLHDPEKGRRTG